MRLQKRALLCSLAASLTLISAASRAQEAKGWDRTVRVADYLEPAIPHEAQEQAALEKLRQFEAKTGRKPNILIMLVDDMGYGDPGAYGGGAMLGAPTPNIDQAGRRRAEADIGLCDAGLHTLARGLDDRPHSSTQRPYAASACQRSPDKKPVGRRGVGGKTAEPEWLRHRLVRQVAYRRSQRNAAAGCRL